MAGPILVPDTSVLIDGRITELIESGDYADAHVLVPAAALAELEAQANRGLETGFSGLEELRSLQKLARTGAISIEIAGQRPSAEEIRGAEDGAIDALIRAAAVEHGGLFITSDRVQAYAASAQGIEHHYVRPLVDEEPDLTRLEIWKFFDDDVLSVHLKDDCQPMVKRGRPGQIVYESVGVKAIGHKEMRRLAKECIEFAKRDYRSFIEMERHGCTVIQLGPMRIVIAQPPFSDGLEVTAVRPITKLNLDAYELPPDVLERLEGRSRGVLVAGPPGSGKSTFATAVADHLHEMGRVVKTMEQPRDLQLPAEVTQYGALDRDMAWTGEVLLLVRPDHVVYDEVRTTNDFKVFADMRLAGVGLFGVSHANRAIDAVQRFLGRVDLGMIPQVVDTVVFIEDGRIAQILELSFTVRVPAGMTQEDLARPVVVVKDVGTGEEVYELYTYGEQIVVMPLSEVGGRGPTGASALAQREVERMLRRYIEGPYEIEMRGNQAVVHAMEWAIPGIIGKGGRTVQGLERKLGIRLDIRAMEKAPRRQSPARSTPAAPVVRPPSGAIEPRFRRTQNNVFLLVDEKYGGCAFAVHVEDGVVGEATASAQGRLRFKASSTAGEALVEAHARGYEITCHAV